MNKQQFKAKVFSSIVKFYKFNNLLGKGDFVLVGVSAGADSVCLLHFLSVIAKKDNFEIAVVHVNHGIRKAAVKDKQLVQKLCKQLGLKFYTKKVDAKKYAKTKGLSLEHSARNLRYDVFLQFAKKHKANKIALAHHLDDHIETIFLNILRGTKAKGFLGIPVKRKLTSKIEIVRPFLAIGKKEVLDYAKHNDLKFLDDETNADDKFRRNWLRNTVIPMLEKKQPQIKKHLQLMSSDLQKFIKIK
ncbi:MAG: tRNA lysidine(34) synthetase TilS [Elusimicrobiaceae bacterium]|jgi:tRNA(Ile)-lysidine synthase|nr:tRNA lysidine(34) synthetase TilS [Elusimicrobiaceae bacterium]MBT3955621.1 tRNA lysidine(34) synthetase TilS [Elusimicrobiaceae bacterium]MBT4008735.1 tRNA lysidine(34) synthetase TilS [Elusimicrobiaceae bacterium]MBT4402776.1 tRNA lysidine(34) synthetase TilS [Elusimicrobiaceae bacterium]MBT4439589.1 tRNA lysidine(34) synthetase TilS [Elusimicrobiaceae bacterium]